MTTRSPAPSAPTAGRRRNPQSSRPHRTGGPAPPPSPKEAAALSRAAARARRLWLANFKRTRGFPEGTDADFIEVCRRHGRWYNDIRPPDD